MLISLAFIVILIAGLCCCQVSNRKYTWDVSALWSSCSVSCGLGTRHRLFICVRRTFYGTREEVDEGNCKWRPKPTERITETCFYGYCPKKDSAEFVWKVSEWSKCSKSCGGGGVRVRDVICTMVLKSESRLEVPYSNCMINAEPDKFELCAHTDCPPGFVTTPWNKCTKVRECRPGIRRRNILCIATLGNSNFLEVSLGYCYKRAKPPIGWEFCLNDPDFQENCRFRKEVDDRKIPVIITNNFKVHQMRRINKLHLIVGQEAHVLPHTFLVIKCEVSNYPSGSLMWAQGHVMYKYIGKVSARISVSRRGALHIDKFLPRDEGQWMCMARNISANITLSVKSPSKGFEEWVSRNAYRKETIVGIRAENRYMRAVSYQWVVGRWSTCTTTCGDPGYQSRGVNCEEILSQYFLVVEEQLCRNHTSQKPRTVRRCVGMKECPKWTVDKSSSSTCGNRCVDIGQALLNNRVWCQLNGRVLPDGGCSRLNKPSNICSNPKCDVFWRVGRWSKCSSSCGTPGVRSRILNCVWKNDYRLAGNICYNKSLKVPQVMKTCTPPSCKLGCADLSTFCGVKTLCNFNRYRFICCETCSRN